MRGYRLDQEASVAAFEPGGWLRTGDGGEVDAMEPFACRDRLADVIVSGGEKIWPAEVERALASHPDVAAVLVSASPDREWGSAWSLAWCRRAASAPPTLDALRDHAASTIARHKLPRELILVDTSRSHGAGQDPAGLTRAYQRALTLSQRSRPPVNTVPTAWHTDWCDT